MQHYKHIIKKVSDLIPYANNSRTHSEEQTTQIASSIKEFGFTNPILIDDKGGLIAGHGRLIAANKLTIKEVPCIVLEGLTEAQKKAYIIADNQLPLNAGWDLDLLKIEIEGLQELDFNIDLLGFDDDFMDGLLYVQNEEGLTDEDEVPEPPETPVSVLGDIWQLGNHRLMCGDSTSIDAVDKLMDGNEWHTCVFDPPYEIESLYNDAMPPHISGAKLCVFWDFKRFGVGAAAAVNNGWDGLYEFIWDNITSWYTPNRPLARHKTCGVFGDDPKFNFDEAIIQDGKFRKAKTVKNTRGTSKYKPLDGAVHLSTVFSLNKAQMDTGGHQHGKPIAWVEAIFNGVGGVKYLDLFGGSGSTIIACEKTRRECFTMELNPINVDIIVKRWQDYTGKIANCKSDELKIIE